MKKIIYPNTSIMKELPEYKNSIKARCGALGWSAAKLSARMSNAHYPVSKKTIHAWFQQRKQPSKKATYALCKIFDTHIRDILYFVEDNA